MLSCITYHLSLIINQTNTSFYFFYRKKPLECKLVEFLNTVICHTEYLDECHLYSVIYIYMKWNIILQNSKPPEYEDPEK